MLPGGFARQAWSRREDVSGARLDWRLVGQVLHLARPYRSHALAFTVATLLGSALVAAPPLLFKQVIDRAVPRHDLGLLTRLSLGAVGLIVLRSLLNLVGRWQAAHLGNGMVFQLRRRLFAHVQRLPVGFFVRTQTGALLSRLNADVQGAQTVLSSVITAVASNATQLVSVIAVMVALDLRLTAVVLTVVPAFLLVTKWWAHLIQRITRRQLEATAELSAHLTERLSPGGAQLVHLFGTPEREAEEMAGLAGAVRKLTVEASVAAVSVSLLVSVSASIATAVLYLLGGRAVIDGSLTVGTVVLFAAYAERVYTPLNDLTSLRVDVMTAMVSFERVFEVLELPNAITDRPGAVALGRPAGRVELRDVSFAYPPASQVTLASLESPQARAGADRDAPSPVLHGVSFVAEPGSTVAVVGPTGAGKSTLLGLVPRLLEVTGGAVLLDGHDVRDLTLSSLRRAVGVVSQETHLFHDTMAANLRFAKPGATVAELERACRVARIHDLLASLPDGYDTVAGERGLRLSGGEKQRLAIARMVLKDPAIVVLDEATAHLDSRNEALIQEALTEALRGRTTLVIAHRLSTVVGADQILVLDAGRVVERGTHAELLARGGRYRELWTSQRDDPEREVVA